MSPTWRSQETCLSISLTTLRLKEGGNRSSPGLSICYNLPVVSLPAFWLDSCLSPAIFLVDILARKRPGPVWSPETEDVTYRTKFNPCPQTEVRSPAYVHFSLIATVRTPPRPAHTSRPNWLQSGTKKSRGSTRGGEEKSH